MESISCFIGFPWVSYITVGFLAGFLNPSTGREQFVQRLFQVSSKHIFRSRPKELHPPGGFVSEHILPLMKRDIRRSPVEVGSLSHYYTGFYYTSQRWVHALGFLKHQPVVSHVPWFKMYPRKVGSFPPQRDLVGFVHVFSNYSDRKHEFWALPKAGTWGVRGNFLGFVSLSKSRSWVKDGSWVGATQIFFMFTPFFLREFLPLVWIPFWRSIARLTTWWFPIFLYVHPKPWGRWTQFDEHIFQMGWFNHQLVYT